MSTHEKSPEEPLWDAAMEFLYGMCAADGRARQGRGEPDLEPRQIEVGAA